MSNRGKDRDISIADFLMNLQKEYFINDFRRKIYASPSDKRYHKKVMEYKQEKIEDISSRNKLPNIFSSEEVKKVAYATMFNDLNQPIFEMNDKDSQFYYDYNSEFIIHTIKRVAKIQQVDFAKGEATLLLDEELYHAKIADISRVL